MKISLIHMKVRNDLQKNLLAASNKVKQAARTNPNFIALPEYFSVPNNMENFDSAEKISKQTAKATFDFLMRCSKENPEIYLLGGTLLEEENGKFYNTSTLWLNGKLLVKYKKINPIAAELNAGVSKGDKAVVFQTKYCAVGMLICADMFDSSIIKKIVTLGAEIVFLPVAAMGTHPHVKGHPLTEKLSKENGIYVIKVGNVSSNARGGRSAVITPWGIDLEVSDAVEDCIINADLDMIKLRKYRSKLND